MYKPRGQNFVDKIVNTVVSLLPKHLKPTSFRPTNVILQLWRGRAQVAARFNVQFMVLYQSMTHMY